MQSFVNSIFITVKQIVAMLNTKQTQKTNKHSSSCLRTGINARFDIFFLILNIPIPFPDVEKTNKQQEVLKIKMYI